MQCQTVGVRAAVGRLPDLGNETRHRHLQNSQLPSLPRPPPPMVSRTFHPQTLYPTWRGLSSPSKKEEPPVRGPLLPRLARPYDATPELASSYHAQRRQPHLTQPDLATPLHTSLRLASHTRPHPTEPHQASPRRTMTRVASHAVPIRPKPDSGVTRPCLTCPRPSRSSQASPNQPRPTEPGRTPPHQNLTRQASPAMPFPVLPQHTMPCQPRHAGPRLVLSHHD